MRRRRERRQFRRRPPAGPQPRRAAAGAPVARDLGPAAPRLLGEDVEFQATGHIKLARSEADMAELERYARDAAESRPRAPAARRRTRRGPSCPGSAPKVVGASLCAEDGAGQSAPRRAGLRAARAPARCRRARARGGDRRRADGGQFRDAAPKRSSSTSRFLVNCAGIGAGTVAGLVRRDRPLAPLVPNMLVTRALALLRHPLDRRLRRRRLCAPGRPRQRHLRRRPRLGRRRADPLASASQTESLGGMAKTLDLVPALKGRM